jgi:hypothetical protein
MDDGKLVAIQGRERFTKTMAAVSSHRSVIEIEGAVDAAA